MNKSIACPICGNKNINLPCAINDMVYVVDEGEVSIWSVAEIDISITDSGTNIDIELMTIKKDERDDTIYEDFITKPVTRFGVDMFLDKCEAEKCVKASNISAFKRFDISNVQW